MALDNLNRQAGAVTMANKSQLDDPYRTPGTLAPPGGHTPHFARLYHWPRSQYYHLLNFVDTTMEQTSSLMTMLHGETSFTNFNRLPPELRIKIWQFAMPEPRTVVVKARNRQMPASLDEALPQALDGEETWRSTTQIPALLHVNAEARHEALKHYTLSLGVDEARPKVYIDFERDTIFFGDAELKPDFLSLWAKTKDLDKIRRLATVPEGMWRVLRWAKSGLGSVQKLIFVHDTEKIRLGSLPQLVEDQLEIEPHLRRLETNVCRPQSEFESPMKQRMRAAREELDTLTRILPTQWEKEPAISTAVFKKNRGDRWVC